MKKKMVIGTLSAALVFGGAFAVRRDQIMMMEVRWMLKQIIEKIFLSIDEVKKIALQEVIWCSGRY